MSRFSYPLFLLILISSAIIGAVNRDNSLKYYSDDILCDYKVPVSCKINKTLYCKGNINDDRSIYILSRCGCNGAEIMAGYGEKIIFDEDCKGYSYPMDGYERLLLGMRVDINRATEQDLVSIEGIGESIAKRIIEYRSLHGRFERIEDLKRIKGIGKNNLSKISRFVCIDCQN